MKIICFNHQGQSSWGAVIGQGVVDIGRRWLTDFNEALYQTDPQQWQTRCQGIVDQVGNNLDFAVEELQHEPPLSRSSKIICIGVNYAHRHKEYQDKPDAPTYPSVFMRTPESFVGHHQALVCPAESSQLDYEGEIALVMAQKTHRISPEQAMSRVLGYTLMNEGSVRDWIRHGKFNVTQGKNFFASGSVGPYITTADELPSQAWHDLRLQTWVNDELRQDDTTSNLMFPFENIISYLSIFMTLHPGDIIATGTPNGSGARLNPPQYLQVGDQVKVGVAQLGELENPIAKAQDAPMTVPVAVF